MDCQCGFWRSRSSSDHLFCICQILEEKWEYNEAVHQLFVDCKKAYDALRREVLYNILIEGGIPMKLVRLIKMCLNETYIRVQVGNHLSDMKIALFWVITQRVVVTSYWWCRTTYRSIFFFLFLTPYNLSVMDNYTICHCIILVDSVLNLVKTWIQACGITP